VSPFSLEIQGHTQAPLVGRPSPAASPTTPESDGERRENWDIIALGVVWLWGMENGIPGHVWCVVVIVMFRLSLRGVYINHLTILFFIYPFSYLLFL
jgi:hypothetical protein